MPGRQKSSSAGTPKSGGNHSVKKAVSTQRSAVSLKRKAELRGPRGLRRILRAAAAAGKDLQTGEAASIQPAPNGREKWGKFGETIGVRLPREIDGAVRELAMRAPLAYGSPARVIKTLVEDWIGSLASESVQVESFDAAALRVAQRRLAVARALAEEARRSAPPNLSPGHVVTFSPGDSARA